MRSSELAALAGVTVRTLRHYHQVGILDEPDRSANGYRRYDVRHLIWVLRIVRLTKLGIPLAALPEPLDEPAAAVELLAELDRDAAAEIERLQARRELIAKLRHDAASPDTPRWLTGQTSAFTEAEAVAPELARYEREHLILLGHLAGKSASEVLSDAYARLDATTPGAMEVYRRFHTLGPDCSDSELEHLADDLDTLYGSVLRELTQRPEFDLAAPAAALLAEFADYALNEQQRRTLLLLEQRLTTPDPDGSQAEDRGSHDRLADQEMEEHQSSERREEDQVA